MKQLLRSLLLYLHLDITKNLAYDRLTNRIMKKVLKKNSNCIDVGCHKGEMLRLMLRLSPEGTHHAFEPIPQMANQLKEAFKTGVKIHACALSDSTGKTTFQYVTNAPAYSGIRRRKYAVTNPQIEEIEVEMNRLDAIIPPQSHIDFIKIDVEGGELNVLKGAERILRESKPLILFECGKGASEFYGTQPEDVFRFVTEKAGMQIATLQDYMNDRSPLTAEAFESCFNTGSEYYFIAYPGIHANA